MKLEEKILKLRKEAGLSQEEFGDKINVSRQAVSKWENGETKPDIEKIKLISELFNVSYNYLLDDNENEKSTIDSSNKKTNKRSIKILKIICFILLFVLLVFLLYRIEVYYVIYNNFKKVESVDNLTEYKMTIYTYDFEGYLQKCKGYKTLVSKNGKLKIINRGTENVSELLSVEYYDFISDTEDVNDCKYYLFDYQNKKFEEHKLEGDEWFTHYKYRNEFSSIIYKNIGFTENKKEMKRVLNSNYSMIFMPGFMTGSSSNYFSIKNCKENNYEYTLNYFTAKDNNYGNFEIIRVLYDEKDNTKSTLKDYILDKNVEKYNLDKEDIEKEKLNYENYINNLGNQELEMYYGSRNINMVNVTNY